MLSKNLTIQLLFLLFMPQIVEQMENDDDSKYKDTLEYLVGPYATSKTPTTQRQFPSSHDEFSLQPYVSHQASTQHHQFPFPSPSNHQFYSNLQNPFPQHFENNPINPSPIQQSYEYPNNANTFENFIGPYTNPAPTQQHQFPSNHEKYSLQPDNPSSSNINSQSTKIKTHNDVYEFANKICQYFKNLKFKENQKSLEKLLFDTKQRKKFRTIEVNDILFIEKFCLDINLAVPQIKQEIVKLHNNFGDYWHFIKTRQFKCFKYYHNNEGVNVDYYICAEKKNQNCSVRLHQRNYFDIKLKKEHTCFKSIPNTVQTTICVIPKKENHNSTCYCILMEYLNENSNKTKYFVGSQSVGEECNNYLIPANLNKFTVTWVENVNIEFEKPDKIQKVIFILFR